MADLEIIKLCADAIGINVHLIAEPEFHYADCPYYEIPELTEQLNEKYDPLHDDAQAMALVKKFELNFGCVHNHAGMIAWKIFKMPSKFADSVFDADSTDLNRAICECVAKMQSAKVAA